MLRTKVLCRTGLRATQACCTYTCICTAVVGRLSMLRIWTAIRSQFFYRVHIRTLDGQSITFTSNFSRKSLVARVCVHYLGPGQNCSGRWVSSRVRDFVAAHVCTLVHGAVQHNQRTFVTIVKSSPYDDKWTDITICSLHTYNNVPLILPPTHLGSSICLMQLEIWLISHRMPPVVGGPNTMTSYPLMAVRTMN